MKLTYNSGIDRGQVITTTTAVNGTYSFAGLPAGSLTLLAGAASTGNLFGEI